MSDTPRCLECGTELPSDAPRGLCPRCLLRQGLDDVGATVPPSTEARGGGSEPTRGVEGAIARWTPENRPVVDTSKPATLG
jgi:hypothetical protein